VHAPQVPWSQPFFVPVSASLSRKASSSVSRGSSATSTVRPLMERRTGDGSGPTRESRVTVAISAADTNCGRKPSTSAGATTRPRNQRREISDMAFSVPGNGEREKGTQQVLARAGRRLTGF